MEGKEDNEGWEIERWLTVTNGTFQTPSSIRNVLLDWTPKDIYALQLSPEYIKKRWQEYTEKL